MQMLICMFTKDHKVNNKKINKKNYGKIRNENRRDL
jgi:hypothetical protein